ncbi:hypothetical protein GCM10023107_08200 [Actinoplanes octamycinicus]|nr:hypothetical protein Aoc01nite_09730 [Actinoplanes octamycinicus]
MLYHSPAAVSFADDRAPLYLLLAAIFMVVGLRYLKRALEPFGAVIGAAAAAAVVAFSLGAGLIFLLAAIASR